MMRAERRLTPNQRERHRRILLATRNLVAKHGYDGMIMRDVAMLANVSPTTLYNLYNTKDELVLAALRDSLTESWAQPAAETDGPGVDYLLATLCQSVAQTQSEPAYSEAIVQALLRAGKGDALIDVLLRGSRNPVAESLSAMAQRNELLSETDIEAVSDVLIGAFWSGYLLWSKGVVGLDRLEPLLKRSYLSVLIPVCRADVRRELEDRYRELDCDAGAPPRIEQQETL
jgi:AcrR family transcriptional regulator